MNRILLHAGLAFAFAGVVAAQQAGPAQSSPSDSTASGKSFHYHHRSTAHREAAMLSRRLNLTPDQTAKVEPILADRDRKLSSLYGDQSLAPDAKRSQRRSIRLDTQQQFANIFTPEQMQKMQAMHHHHGGHEQAPPTPSGL